MNQKWWHNQVVYQIYPRSFFDSNKDGIGDLNGIREKLDYLEELGIQIIWLCPVYQSPNDDNGYDISDYYNIMDEFGTMEDFCNLIEESKNHGISLMMDLVLNHSSDEHTWFMQSRSSRENPYRDFYIWEDAKNGKEPTEDKAFFGGSVWEWDEKTNQYYLHSFSKKQPDLNWDNSKVREELYQMIRFWMEKGVDGFRLDAIDTIGKNSNHQKDLASGKVHQFLYELNQNTFSLSDHIVTVGETGSATVESAKLFSAPERQELDMIFQFELMSIDGVRSDDWHEKKFTLLNLKHLMTKWQTELDGVAWNSLFWNSHDYPRVVSRFGNDKEPYRVLSAKMLATLLHGMKGTPYIYQGEELGMTNAAFSTIADYQDIETKNFYERMKQKNWSEEKIMKYIYRNSRDNARTPMQWDASSHAGFTKGTPWIKVNSNYTKINVDQCLKDPNSIFYHYKKLIQLRKEKDTLVYGKFQPYQEQHEQVFAYTRQWNEETILIICNFYEKETNLPTEYEISQENILISNYNNLIVKNKTLYLRPYEAIMIQVGGQGE